MSHEIPTAVKDFLRHNSFTLIYDDGTQARELPAEDAMETRIEGVIDKSGHKTIFLRPKGDLTGINYSFRPQQPFYVCADEKDDCFSNNGQPLTGEYMFIRLLFNRKR